MMRIKNILCLLFLFLLSTSLLEAQDANLTLANDQLMELAAEKNYTTADVANPVVSDYYTSKGITHIYYQQSVDQIGIFGTSAAVHLKDNAVFLSTINFLKGIQKRAVKKQFQVQAVEALVRLAQNQNYPLSQTELVVLSADEAAPEKPTAIRATGISNRTIPLKLVFIEDANRDLQLAWSVFIDEKESANYKNFLVNATTGAIEKEINLTITCQFDHDHTQHHKETIPSTNNRLGQLLRTHQEKIEHKNTLVANSYHVFPMPIESPNFGNRSIEVSPWEANPTASPNGWHQVGTTNYTSTKGNNVDAYEDSNSTNQPTSQDAARVDGGENLTFDHPLDLAGSAGNYKPAAITNLFYWSNIIHDVWYNYGFDEPSGNFQEENYNRGGNGGDYVYAEAQDGSGTCNANMSTPSDGGNPRMQMYVCGARDGDFDNGVIVHEYGHGISTRLTGGPATSGCLNNQEQMGEGWSDWFGLVMTIQPEDNATKARPMGTWLFEEGPTGDGIRPYPYSTDMTVNPMTYGTLASSEIRAPHGVGAVWATVLWDLTWAMIEQYGKDADLYNGTGGNNRTMALVIESLKLQPCSPGFVDGRDAILAADRLLYGGDNQCLIWEVFARRGLGYSADQGSTSSKSDGTEAFDMPPSCTISLVKTVDKTTANLGDTVTYTLNAINQQNNTLDSLVFTDFLPATLEFVSASDNGQATNQVVTWPPIDLNAGESATRTIVTRIKSELIEPDPLFIDNLEDGITNWQVTNDGGTATWDYQNTKANSGSHAFHSPGAQPNSYANLTSSTSFGLTETSELIFHHYYDIESEWDAGVIQISIDNGANWQDLGQKITQNGYTGTTFYGFEGFYGASTDWVETKIDLSDFAFRKVLIRFQMRYDESVFEEGWFIDDIKVTNLGLSAVNRAQIGNRDITTTASVNQATAVNFVSHNCFNSFNWNFNTDISPNEYRFVDDLAISGVIKSGDQVGFYSSISVTLLPGFAAENGSDVIVAIETCKEGNQSTLTTTDSTIVTARTNTRINLNPTVLENKLIIRPNPFSEQAIIDYHLATSGDLWIGLHDITGKIVKILYNQTNTEAGDYQLLLQSEHLENGAYWLTMRTHNDLLTKKLFLIRN